MEYQLVSRAKEIAKEISEKSGVPVKVDPKIKGCPTVLTEYDTNMSIAREALRGIEMTINSKGTAILSKILK